MFFSKLAAAATLASTVSAHATIYGVWVNGEDQGDGRNTYIRSPPNNSPVKVLNTADIACNVNGATEGTAFVSAAAGDTITTEWYHNTRSDDIIDGSHKGPIITYIAQYTEGDGTGAIWSKIDEAGLAGGVWAVDTLIANAGKYDFTIPSALKAGQYLIRQEIIAHHESDSPPSATGRGAQFYPSCIQFEITGSGSAVPDQAFDFNTGYTAADPGILFNLYGGATTYDIPGPAVWSAAAGGDAPVPTTAAPTTAAPTTAAPTTAAPTTTVVPTTTAVPTTAVPTTIVTSVKPSVKPTTAVPTTIVTSARPTTTAAPAQPTTGTGSVALYYQCGGKTYTGATACAEGTCKAWNEWYSQCVPN